MVITCCPHGCRRFTSIWRPLRRTRHQPRRQWFWQVWDSHHACRKCPPSEYYLSNDNLYNITVVVYCLLLFNWSVLETGLSFRVVISWFSYDYFGAFWCFIIHAQPCLLFLYLSTEQIYRVNNEFTYNNRVLLGYHRYNYNAYKFVIQCTGFLTDLFFH